MEKTIGLTDLPRELKTFTGGKTLSYRMLYQKVLNGALPAGRSSGGRWIIDRDDLPKIAETLGLKEAK